MPVFILLLNDRNYGMALLVGLIAGLSDGLDGYIAKRFDLVTRAGAILDPLADKLLLGSAYIMLAILGHIPIWLLIIVAFRDLLIISGFVVYSLILGPLKMTPSYLSKLNTVFQIALVLVILMEQAGLGWLQPLTRALLYIVAIITVSSTLHYLWIWGVKDVEREPDAKGR